MNTAFGHIAPEYDRNFSDTAIGLLQRQIVHDYMQKNFTQKSLDIFEINCGTGVDAAFLTLLGHRVTACDASDEMIKVSQEKYYEQQIKFIRASFSDIATMTGKKYDLIFSNFGGVNCINKQDLNILLKDLSSKLNPNGRLIIIAMGKFCFWESIYFLLKGNFRNAFRRMSTRKNIFARIGTTSIPVFYFSPAELKSDNFKVRKLMPVGTVLPPSYLENYFQNHPKLLNMLSKIDKVFRSFSIFAYVADHYLIDLEKAR